MACFKRHSFLISLMGYVLLFTFSSLLFSCNNKSPKQKYNFNFEQTEADGKPVGWKCSLGRFYTKDIILDSVIKFEGHYSLLLDASIDRAAFAQCKYVIPANFLGKRIELSVFCRSGEGNKTAKLFLRLEDVNRGLLTQMESVDTIGSTNWKRFTVQLPCDTMNAAYVVIGAYVKDSTKVWVDQFQVLVDGVPMEQLKPQVIYPAQRDLTFSDGTNLSLDTLNNFQIDNLKTLGVLWGFLKYHHPEIKKGNVNWDAVLFRTLPQYLNVHDIEARNAVLEKMVFSLNSNNRIDKLGVQYKPQDGSDEKQFDELHLSPKLLNHLKAIEQVSISTATSYYAEAAPLVGNPLFPHEIRYDDPYPDTGLRILTLYRYWSMINYFCVNKDIIGKDWDDVLPEFLPKFIDAKDRESYALVCLELIASIHDTHANIFWNPVLEGVKGFFMTPFQAKFIQNKLVVTDYYTDDGNVRKIFAVGDVIETINGVSVDRLIEKYAPYTPASNYPTMLRNLSSATGFLLRSSNKTIEVTVFNGVERRIRSVSMVPIAKVNSEMDFQNPKIPLGFKFLNSTDILYLYPALLKERDVDSIKLLAQRAIGILIDFRCYPSTFMPFTYGAWLKPCKSPFVLISKIDSLQPGHIRMRDTIYNGSDTMKNFKAKRVAILVNEQTQSAAEYSVMALQTAPLAKVIGSTTAGADGNISYISLPGGIETYISGIGVFYPNGLNTQRAGVKIDIIVKPTIKGIRFGKDEVLERGVKYIINGK